MKNQTTITANGKAEFIDLKNVKNPFYQPLAGKVPSGQESLITSGGVVNNGENPAVNATAAESNSEKSPEVQSLKSNANADKPALNLEGTLKLVEELHRRMVQRGRLVHTIDNLDKFEIEQKQEAEDTTSNYYQGCEIEITDDKRNKFSTKNPVIIKAVAMFVRDLCTNRLAEIEAEITIPA